MRNRLRGRIAVQVDGGLRTERVAARYGHAGLPDDTIVIQAAQGAAGPSCGAWLARGVTLILAGEANNRPPGPLCL